MSLRLITSVTLTLFVSLVARAGPDAGHEPVKQFEFETFSLVLLLRPDEAPVFTEAELEALQRKHIAHLEAMEAAGKLLIAGPFGDQADPTYRGACIYRVPVKEARALAEADPMVKAGRLRVEVMTWAVGKGYMKFPKARPVTR